VNQRALVQIGGELLGEFRRMGGPADRAAQEFYYHRRYLGSSDRRFISDSFYHALRHLRRLDESLVSACTGLWPAHPLVEAGYPVSDRKAARAWQRGETTHAPAPGGRRHNPEKTQWIDSMRIALAAVELQLVGLDYLAPELADHWLAIEAERSDYLPRTDSVLRVIERARDVMDTFRNDTRARNAERTFSFPSWLWGGLGYDLAPAEWLKLGAALLEQSPITLRANTLRCTHEQATTALTEAGINFVAGEWATEAFVLQGRVATSRIPQVREGWFEFQDEASQLCSIFAAPRPDMRVADACAGGGGKTLHIAALMENRGVIRAFDSAPARLEQLVRRKQRAGADIIETGALDAEAKPPKDLQADLVLIDAPCSGTGTLRRNPELKWRLAPERIAELQGIQERLLDTWAGTVVPGGVLVYSTCSLLHEENAARIEAFLAKHPRFRRDPEEGRAALGEKAAKLLNRKGDLALYPHRHGCDGFYAARLRRGK
jgi:16S rRNA (cytosine967-C5)-methyltransferase